MNKISKVLHSFLNVLMGFSLAAMAILVFGNVVLRYAFNSGITWSEEMSRFLFIWMVFLGAIGALKDNEHLGVDMLVKKLPTPIQKVVYTISNILVLYILWLVLEGSWKMTLINMNSTAPATGLPLSFIYGIGVLMSIAMAPIILLNIYKALFVKGAIKDLVRSHESEEDFILSIHHEDEPMNTVQGGVAK